MTYKVPRYPPVRRLDYLCVWWGLPDQLFYKEGSAPEFRARKPYVFVFRGLFKTVCVYPLCVTNNAVRVTGIHAEAAAIDYYNRIKI